MNKIIGLLLLLLSLNVNAETVIETINLLHRSTDEVIPLLTPHLDPQGALTGRGYKLIINSSPQNISRIRALLEEIDIDQSILKISVSYADQSQNTATGGSVSIQAEHNQQTDDSKIKFDTRVYQTKKKQRDNSIQVMSVSEGYWGSISMGQAIPFATRTQNADGTVTESIHYKNIMTGFRIRPQTNGNNVTVTIRQKRQAVDNSGSVQTNTTETVVNGKLGQWIHIGGTDHEQNLNQSGLSLQTRIRSTDVNQLWIKVERP